MTAKAYEDIIHEGIRGLPADCLAEIVDFIYFVRKRVLQPEAFREEVHELTVRVDLKKLTRDEGAHLEKEFEDYERRYPRE